MAAENTPQENPMKTGRRFFLSGVAAALAGTRALLAGGQGQRGRYPPRNPQVPDASNSNGAGDPPLPARADPRVQLKEGQKELRRDVDRLLQLVKDLKDESDKTPETDVLSLSLVKKAEDIEKLARQIKERIRES
jgi:cytochrome P450